MEGEPMSVPMNASSALAAPTREGTQNGPPSRFLCFGNFQFDLQREILFRDGAKLRLPGKVYQTLLTLLEKPGEVVTREVLREKLWPEGTFVNYDANVNTTVNKLRLALGDSSERPSFIETIPRLGYCFVGRVERRDQPQKVVIAAAASGKPLAVEPQNGAAIRFREPFAVNALRMLRSRGWAAVVLLCGVLIGMGIVLIAHRLS
jgi:DNA-binding winged helix-turn-helix (wHTH) protein